MRRLFTFESAIKTRKMGKIGKMGTFKGMIFRFNGEKRWEGREVGGVRAISCCQD